MDILTLAMCKAMNKNVIQDNIKIITPTLAGTGSISAGGKISITLDISDSVPSGYIPVLAVPYYSGDDGFVFAACGIDDDGKLIYVIHNTASSADSGTPKIKVLCFKQG